MVVNGGTNRVMMFDGGGKLLISNFGNRFLSKILHQPTLITELGNRRLAIFDRENYQIKKLSFEEDHVATFDVGLQTYSLTTNIYGHMIMAHQKGADKRIVSIRDSNTGYILHFVTIPNHPQSIPGGAFYAAYNQQTYVIALDQSSCTLGVHTLDGACTLIMSKQGFLPGNLNSPTSLCLDSRDQMIVADSRNDRIVRYKCDNSKQCQVLVTDIHRPLCVAIDNSDHLIVLTAKYILIYDYDIKKPTAPESVLIDGIL